MSLGKRLKKSELDKRVVVKLNKSIKADGVNGIMTFGEDDDYPQMIELAVNGSVTGKAAVNIYGRFLSGDGFENEVINNIIVGTDQRGKSITLRSLLRQVSTEAALYNGFYIHRNVNLNGETGTVHLKSFKNCRFAAPDDSGFSAKILYYENWSKDPDLGRYDIKKAVSYPIFNNSVQAIESQIIKAGSPEKFKGQLYFQFLDNQYFYPLSTLDSSYLDLDTEQQLSLFQNRQLRNGFIDKTLIRVQGGLDEDESTGTYKKNGTIADTILGFMGADGETVMVLEDDIDPATGEFAKNSLQIEPIKGNVDSKLFQGWKEGVSNNIRKSIGGIPSVLIDFERGGLGNVSGAEIIEATNFYNALTNEARTTIEESFAEIFKHSENQTLKNNKDWRIKPFTLIKNESNNDSTATTN